MEQMISSEIGQGAGRDAIDCLNRFHPGAAPANQSFGRRTRQLELMTEIVKT